jgi:hypothetical protein
VGRRDRWLGESELQGRTPLVQLAHIVDPVIHRFGRQLRIGVDDQFRVPLGQLEAGHAPIITDQGEPQYVAVIRNGAWDTENAEDDAIDAAEHLGVQGSGFWVQGSGFRKRVRRATQELSKDSFIFLRRSSLRVLFLNPEP